MDIFVKLPLTLSQNLDGNGLQNFAGEGCPITGVLQFACVEPRDISREAGFASASHGQEGRVVTRPIRGERDVGSKYTETDGGTRTVVNDSVGSGNENGGSTMTKGAEWEQETEHDAARFSDEMDIDTDCARDSTSSESTREQDEDTFMSDS